MKRFFAKAATLCLIAASLTSCGNSFSQAYVDKINNAVTTSDKNDDYTYNQVVKALGKNPILDTTKLVGEKHTGIVTWAKGCKTAEEATQKVKDGKKVETIVVTFTLDVAVLAVYSQWDGSSAK